MAADGEDGALANDLPVVVVLVLKGIFGETGDSGARRDMCSSEPMETRSLGRGGEGDGCSVQFHPGGGGETFC